MSPGTKKLGVGQQRKTSKYNTFLPFVLEILKVYVFGEPRVDISELRQSYFPGIFTEVEMTYFGKIVLKTKMG